MFKSNSQRSVFLLCVALGFEVVCGRICIACSRINTALIITSMLVRLGENK
ncbi:DUF3265 domain-containing protein [Vibrio harveyi]|nr:DUF3265 domain-containing protein [Vibrio harveyi]